MGKRDDGMKRNRFSVAQIVDVLKQSDLGMTSRSPCVSYKGNLSSIFLIQTGLAGIRIWQSHENLLL